MSRLRVMTIVGTRPEILKLSRVIAELERHTQHILVHTGQNYDYELNEVFFRELKIRSPDHFLNAVGETTAQTIGQVIASSDQIIAATQPDAVLIYGDTNSCLSAISAKRRKVPVFHMEAGNRCFDQRVPEEINRKIIDHISDINLAITEHARRYLLAEGLRPETVIKVGSTMFEVLAHYREEIEQSNIRARLDLDRRSYFVASAHREENVDSAEQLVRLLNTLNALAETYRFPIVFSVHPRTRNRLEALQSGGEFACNPLIQLHKPFGFFDYVRLQSDAFCVLSDSGTITEEASILNFPAVTLRESHERPEGMDEAVVVMSGLGRERVLQAVELVTSQYREGERTFRCVEDYRAEHVSQKVVRIILSYVDYINRTVWFRSP
ncbi:MAG: non-hydrolyzing UDP-N-acetylglucosamine 2-epimerase [Pirellulaceae bacterium]